MKSTPTGVVKSGQKWSKATPDVVKMTTCHIAVGVVFRGGVENGTTERSCKVSMIHSSGG